MLLQGRSFVAKSIAAEQDESEEEHQQTPFSAIDCSISTKRSSSSLWVKSTGSSYSCKPLPGDNVVDDPANMCLNSAETPDYTSIVVDMRPLSVRTGCFAWTMSQCSFDLRQVSSIEFDVDMASCGGLWSAPLWLSPLKWIAPQGLSGEIDFVEVCPAPQASTNLGCYSVNTGPGQCQDGQRWGNPQNFSGPKHMSMTLDATNSLTSGGSLTIQVCNLDGTACKVVAKYVDYLSKVYPTQNQRNGQPFMFVSDVWNGAGVDGGWNGCGAQRNAATECSYVIRNIQVNTWGGQPLFTGKCSPLNGPSTSPTSLATATSLEPSSSSTATETVKSSSTSTSTITTKPSSTSMATTTVMPSSTSRTVSWTLHRAINCYVGHGGAAIGAGSNPLPGTFTVAACQAKCQATPGCNAIVVRNYTPSTCWLRQFATPASCVANLRSYNTWTMATSNTAASNVISVAV